MRPAQVLRRATTYLDRHGVESPQATAERLLSQEFWLVLTDRFWSLHLTPYGFLGVMLGTFFAWRSGRALPVLLWALGGFTLFVVSAEGQWNQIGRAHV